MAINTGPAPVPASGNTTVIPASSIDRRPDPLPAGPTSTPIPTSQVDRNPGSAPTPYQPTDSSSPTVPISRPTGTVPAPTPNVVPTTPIPVAISVLNQGNLITSAVKTFDFVGNGVVAVANVRSGLVTVTINQSGSSNGNYSNANVVSLLTSFGSNVISTTGNITAGYFAGNGSLLTGIANNGGNVISNYDSRVDVTAPNGNVVINTDGPEWTFDTAGNSTLPSGGYLNIQGGRIVQRPNDDLRIEVQDVENDGYDLELVVTDGTNDNTILRVNNDQVLVRTNITGSSYNWSFSDTGVFNLAGNINGNYGGDLYTYILNNSSNGIGNIELQVRDYGTDGTVSNVRVSRSNVQIGTGSGTYAWTFNDTGNLYLPNNGQIVIDGGDGVIGPDGDDMVISWDNEALILRAVSDDVQIQADVGFQIDTNYNSSLKRWIFDANGFLVHTSGNTLIYSELGSLTLQGGAVGLGSGNVSISAINTGVTYQTWDFGYNGNLTLPPSGNIVGATANNSGYINWLGNSSGDGGGYTTMKLVPDDTRVGGDQYLIIDPTAPGHIHIRAGGTQDNSGADLFLGGENSYFRVAAGANSEARIAANSYVWTHGTDGTLTLPYEGVIRNIDDSVVLQILSTAGAGNTYSARLGTGGLYLESSIYNNGWLYITNNSGNADINSPSGNISITPAFGVTNGAGKSLNLRGGDADQSDYYTGTGGAVNITGGLGSTTDGGGGGPGGNVNITAGVSSDPAGHAGNINITAGYSNWTFDYTGNLTVSGDLVAVTASPAPNITGFGIINSTNHIQLAVYANATVRDNAIASPQPGMMVYVTGTGMQVRGDTSWNTVAGSGT